VSALVRVESRGACAVYRGRQTDTGRGIVVKVLPAPFDRTGRASFDREQSRIAQLRDVPAILPVDEIGVLADGRPYLISELCAESCADRLRRDGPFPTRQVAWLGRELAGALARAHEAGVVHGAIRPTNVLLRRSGQVVLCDFGTALRHVYPGDPDRDDEFAAPETLCDGVLDPRSDLYGLGATLFVTLTGRVPFPGRIGEHPGARILRVINEPVSMPGPDVAPPALAAVLTQLLASDPDGRPETAAQVADQLAAAFPAPPPVRRPSPPPPPPVSAAPPPAAPATPPPPAGQLPALAPAPAGPQRPFLGPPAEPSTDWSGLLDEVLSQPEPTQLRPAQPPRDPSRPATPGGARAEPDISGSAEPPGDRPPGTHRLAGLVVAGAVAVLLLVLVGRFAHHGGGSAARSSPGSSPAGTLGAPAPGGSSSPLAVHLVSVNDAGESAQLTWTGDPAMEYAVVVAQSGRPSNVVLVKHAHTASIPIVPGRPYCFVIQATNGSQVIETDPRPIRGAVCDT
jgi:serine/threonine protein kinase